MSVTVRTKKSKVLFTPEELFMIKEMLSQAFMYYDDEKREQLYKDYGIVIGDDWQEKQTKLQKKISHIFDASREWDFEGFEYR
jgi:hypothetical protein